MKGLGCSYESAFILAYHSGRNDWKLEPLQTSVLRTLRPSRVNEAARSIYHPLYDSRMIKIKKISDGMYSAEVYKLPPNLDWVKPEWATSAPMSAKELIRELLVRGHHQSDIGDAFYEADPGWLNE